MWGQASINKRRGLSPHSVGDVTSDLQRRRLIRFDAIASGGFGAIQIRVGAREGDGGILLHAELRNARGDRDASGFRNGEVLHVLADALGEDTCAGETDFGQ